MRNVTAAMQAHLEQAATTVCVVIKIVCQDGDTFGFADHDKDVPYDDGSDTNGPVVYRAREGYEQSPVAATTGLGVDNAEATGRVAVWDYPDHITEEQINAGKLTGAEQWVYLVNYEDPSMGHVELHSGNVGQVKIIDGDIWNTELLALSARMKQDIVPLTSVTCRRVFGDSVCGIDAEALFEPFEVTDIDFGETDRIFEIDLAPASGFYDWGLVRWTSGANSGTSPEVEGNAGPVVVLATPTRYPVQVGDQGLIRIGCRKRFREDCIGVHDNGLNFDGEPDLPLADEDADNVSAL